MRRERDGPESEGKLAALHRPKQNPQSPSEDSVKLVDRQSSPPQKGVGVCKRRMQKRRNPPPLKRPQAGPLRLQERGKRSRLLPRRQGRPLLSTPILQIFI